MPSQRIAITVTPNSGTPVSGSSTVTDIGIAGLGTSTLPSAQTNVAYDVAFPFARLKSYVLYSPVAMTIKTNSSGAPDDTIALPAGELVAWNTSSLHPKLFTADVTQFFITNVLAAAGVTLEFIYDPTA